MSPEKYANRCGKSKDERWGRGLQLERRPASLESGGGSRQMREVETRRDNKEREAIPDTDKRAMGRGMLRKQARGVVGADSDKAKRC